MKIKEIFFKTINCGSVIKFRQKELICDNPYYKLFAEIRLTAINGKVLSWDILPEDVKYSFQIYFESGKTKFRLDNDEPQKPAHMHTSNIELPCYGPLGVLANVFFSNFPN